MEPLSYLTHGFPFCQNLASSYEENRRVDVTHAVVFPFCTSLYYDLPSLARGIVKLARRIGDAPFHFENEQLLRQLYEIFPGYRRMFIPFAMIDTLRETRGQVRVLDDLLNRYPFYGLKVHPRTTQARLSTLGREGRPLLEFAKAHDLPILVHAAYQGSPDSLSQISDLLALARAHPSLRFCAAHFWGFHQPTFEEIAQYDNVWVDSAAMCIGCDLVLQGSTIYESGQAKIPSNYRDPPKVFADIARRFPDHFMFGTDNPGYSYVSNVAIKPGDQTHRFVLWSTIEREKELLSRVSGALYRKVAFENALRFIEG
ncbi:MAG: amidohydrolase family protein [Holophaga sp.]|nr:amidohydrolase family protein [Holophaga sp.]